MDDRQKRAVEYLRIRGRITTQEYVELVETSLITAKRDLLDLKARGGG